MLQEASFKKNGSNCNYANTILGMKKKKMAKQNSINDKVNGQSLQVFAKCIHKVEKYHGIWPESIASVSLHHRYFRTNTSIQSPNLHLICESEVTQSCPTLCDAMDLSLPGFSVNGIFQARILEWVAISFSRGSSQPRDQTRVSHIGGRRFTV